MVVLVIIGEGNLARHQDVWKLFQKSHVKLTPLNDILELRVTERAEVN